jgi:hypothetical protein
VQLRKVPAWASGLLFPPSSRSDLILVDIADENSWDEQGYHAKEGRIAREKIKTNPANGQDNLRCVSPSSLSFSSALS